MVRQGQNLRVAMEAEVGGAAEGKVVAEGEVAEEAAAEVAEVRPPPPPVPGLVLFRQMAPCG